MSAPANAGSSAIKPGCRSAPCCSRGWFRRRWCFFSASFWGAGAMKSISNPSPAPSRLTGTTGRRPCGPGWSATRRGWSTTAAPRRTTGSTSMTSGRRGRLIGLVAVLGLLGPAIGQPQEKSAAALEQLMQELSQVQSARGRFIERKYLAMLNAPLESSGTLYYAAPGRLEKHTLSPRQESLILEGETLVIDNKETGQRRSFPLQEHPVVWAFVESIRSTLAGDLPT